MWNLLDETIWSNTNQFNSKRFRCSETKFKIVVNLENTHVWNIFDDSKINRIWVDSSNDFSEKHTVIERMEERFTIASDWEIVL